MSDSKRLWPISSRKTLYIIQFIIISIPLLYPMQLPQPVSKYTQSYYDFVKGIPEGSTVIFDNEVSGASWPLLGSAVVRSMVILWENDCKLLFFCMLADGVPFIVDGIEEARGIYESRNPNAELIYDENYVVLGYVSGLETGLAAFLSNPKGLLTKDYYGNAIDDLTLLKDINGQDDMPFCIWASAGSESRNYVLRQYTGKVAQILVTLVLPTVAPYLATGQISGAIVGSAASAQFEFLTSIPGPNARLANTLSLVSMLVILVLLLGNAQYFYGKFKGGSGQ